MGPSFLEDIVTSGVNFVQTKIAVHENNKCLEKKVLHDLHP
jgi:hypothetical protein